MGASMPNPTAGERREELLASGFVRWEQDLAESPTTLYAGLGSVARFPDYWESVADRESADSLSAFLTRPERTTQLDAGVLYRSERFEASAAAFYGRIDDYILIESNYPKGVRRVAIVRNIDAASYGGEADAAYRLSPRWKAKAALAYTRGRNETDRLPLAQTPPLEIRSGVEYDDRTWSAGLTARFVFDQERFALGQGNIVGQDLGRGDGFATVAAYAGWRPARGVAVLAGVDNLLDRDYAEHVSRGGGMIAGFPQTLRVNEPGRTAWLRVSADFGER